MKSLKSLLIIFLDGFGFNYVNNEDAPFLIELGRRGLICPLKSLLGYSATIKATIWTGVYPRSHGYWTHWGHVRGAVNQPMLLYSLFNVIPNRKWRIVARQFVLELLEKSGSRLAEFYLAAIPKELIPYFSRLSFDYDEEYQIGGVPTFFKFLKENGVSYTYHKAMWLDKDPEKYVEKMKTSGNQVDIFFFKSFDLLSHRYGPHSPRVRREVRKFDLFLHGMYHACQERFELLPNILVFSDHSLDEVKRKINLQRAINQTGFKQPRDYLAFYDSTLARFWFFCRDAEKSIRETLETLEEGSILSKDHLSRFGLDFEDNRFGDLIFLADPGVILFPNYYVSVLPKWIRTARGMHGWDPSDPAQKGLLICYTPKWKLKGNVKEAVVLDILPTMLDILNLPTPKYCEGQSLISSTAK